jgi:ADP-ribose pyrophosphatase YjhB (NUDIX family)
MSAKTEKDKILQEIIQKTYGNKLRLRSCGICIEGDTILLVKHKGIGELGYLWSPPGGGVEFGESLVAVLQREIAEECGLTAKIGDLIFVDEFIKPPLHAVEFFFKIAVSGTLIKGKDPEMSEEHQMIEEVKYVSWEEIKSGPTAAFHRMFERVNSLQGIFELKPALNNRAF